MTSFTDLGVDARLVTALGNEGIREPFPIQSLTVPDALAGRDVCGEAQTGSGKTVAFAVPLVQRLEPDDQQRSPRGLVLVPTRELALQVLGVFRPLARAAGVRVTAVYGGVSLDRQVSAARRGLDIVVATPGRLIDLVERGAISLDRVEAAVIDEADRMADLGFLPQVEWLLRHFHDHCKQLMLFSATLDGQVDGLVRSYLSDPVRHAVEKPTPTVEDMAHCFLAVHQMDRVRVAASIARAASRTLVFVRTKRGADRLARQLTKESVRTEAIHGDLRQGARTRALERFAAGTVEALVATDVAARGIHVDDIDVVVHFDPPEDHKAYLHRSGRTARAGRAGTVATFVLWDQVTDVERLQRRLGVDQPIVEIFSNDARLTDLNSLASPVGATA
jgi:superfamily II DNA/RNA helicase